MLKNIPQLLLNVAFILCTLFLAVFEVFVGQCRRRFACCLAVFWVICVPLSLRNSHRKIQGSVRSGDHDDQIARRHYDNQTSRAKKTYHFCLSMDGLQLI